MKKAFTLLAVMFVTSLSGLGYFIFFSDAPYQMVGHLMEKNGFHVTGVTGNLNSGFKFGHLERKNEDMEFVAENVALSHNGLIDIFTNKRIVVLGFDVGSLHVKFLKPTQELKTKWTQDEKDSAKEKAPKNQATEVAGGRSYEFRIDAIRVKDVKIESPDLSEPWVLSELTVGDLISKNGEFGVQKVVVRSGALDFQVNGLQIGENGVHHEDKILGTFHPTSSNRLRKDVALALKLETREKSLTGEVALFDSKMQAKFSGTGPCSVQFADFTPSEYFKTELPLIAANVRVDLPNVLLALMAPIPFSGQIAWRQFPFVFPAVAPSSAPSVTQPALYAKGKNLFFITFKPQFNVAKKSLDMESPWFELSSVPVRTKRENLSVLYFSKPYERLKPDEKSAVEKDEVYFSEPAPLQMSGRAPASFAAPVPVPVSAPVPASVGH